jgi:adenylosuccinate lyase
MHETLNAISPVDGRYAPQTEALRNYFSEKALFRYRLRVEVEYLLALAREGFPLHGKINTEQAVWLRQLYIQFNDEDVTRIKVLERTTNHDIKALEYFIKEKLEQNTLNDLREWVHFGLTSQDINNTAIPLSLKEASEEVLFPMLAVGIEKLRVLAQEWKNVAMLAHTHGQAASPTTVGKEINVFAERLEIEFSKINSTVWAAKFGGATGNFNAHYSAFPEHDWSNFAQQFIADLGLFRSKTTTQIEHYDQLASYCHNLMRLHTILIDLCRDVWMYIMKEYFRQKVKAGEIGSSAMPHKVNPIDFENAEGNLGIANALLAHFADKLPVSRLQRDLSDSTVLRNLGVPLAHSLIALKSIEKGFNKLILNEKAINADLEKNAVVIAEGIQTILRRDGYPNPYEALKELTRGKDNVSIDEIRNFIKTLEVSEKTREELLLLHPSTYIGNAGLSQ